MSADRPENALDATQRPPSLEATHTPAPAAIDATHTPLPGIASTRLSGAPSATASALPLRRAVEVGRFLLLEKLGEGGMGEVWLGYDPKLDRRIALKFLRPEHADSGSESGGAARLQREAQVMAQLKHPNVVQVFDVGEHEGGHYVAMELLPGGTLRSWREAGARSWREVVAAYVEAGRGLQAAHAAGLVHRDFKPDNVLLEADGTPKVGDFGLARLTPNDPAGGASSDVRATHGPLGTPAYMPPEQFRGERADARSDQFSFCASLWEALFGQRPFPGEDFASVREAVLGGRVLTPTDLRGVPRRISRPLLRGLSVDPKGRFPDMETLLHDLERGRRFSWRRVGAWVVALSLVGGGAAWAGQRIWLERTRCAREATLRSPRPAPVLARALEAAAVGQRPGLWREWRHWMGEAATAWERHRTVACERLATEPAVAAELACLDAAADSFSAELQGLSHLGASPLAARLDQLRARDVPGIDCPAIERGPVRGLGPLEPRLRELEGVWRADDAARTVSLARTLAAEAADAGARAVEARALEIEGRTTLGSFEEDPGEGRRLLRAAAERFDAAGDDLGRARTLQLLVNALVDRDEGEAATETLQELRRVTERMGRPPFWDATVESMEANLLATGNREAAYAHAVHAVETFRPLAGAGSGFLAELLALQATAGRSLPGRLEEALAAGREAVRLYEEIDGPGSWGSFWRRNSLATLLVESGRQAAALEELDIAWRDRVAASQGNDADHIAVLQLRAQALFELERFEEATREVDQALSLVASTSIELVRPSHRATLWALRSRLLAHEGPSHAREAIVAASHAQTEAERAHLPVFATDARLARLQALALIDPHAVGQELDAIARELKAGEQLSPAWDLLAESVGWLPGSSAPKRRP